MNRSVQRLLAELQDRYASRLIPYGCNSLSDVQHGFGFRLSGISATFSVVTLDGELPDGRYDVQIESHPPGDFVWTAECDLAELLEQIAEIDRDIWPL